MPARALALACLSLALGCSTSRTGGDGGRPDTHSACTDGPAVGCLCFTPGEVHCGDDAYAEVVCSGGAWRESTGRCLPDAGPVDAPPFDAPMPDAPVPPASFGEPCTSDAMCGSGNCWNFSDIDIYCFGRGCTISCTTDAECQDAARDAGAPTPEGATCSPVRGCDLENTGLVAVACS